MITKKGWWKLTIEGVGDLTDEDREHVANLIKDGFTEGEILQQRTCPSCKSKSISPVTGSDLFFQCDRCNCQFT